MDVKRVGLYVRISKKRNDQMSLPMQEAEGKAFIAGKPGWQLVKVFVEDGRSAYRKGGKRPKFDTAMATAQAGGLDVLLVWKLDRFYRSGAEFNRDWLRLESWGCEFHSVMESWIDTSTPNGRAQMSALAYQAEIESYNKSLQAKAWHRQRNSETEGAAIPGGNRPYGYDRVETTKLNSYGQTTKTNALKVNPKEAAVIREAAALLLAGKPLRFIHQSLKPQSAQPREGGSSLMSDRGLRAVLTNPTTYGLKDLPTGALVKGCWSPILDPSTYGQVCSILADPKRRSNAVSGNQVSHLLSGLIHCGKCQGKQDGRKGKLYARSNRNRYKCECGTGIDEAKTDAVVLKHLWQTVTQDVWQGWKLKGHGHDTKVRDSIQARMDHLDMQFLAGKFDDDLSRFDSLMATMKDQLALAMSDEPLDLPDVADIQGQWDDLSVKDQRKVITQAFSSITVTPAAGSYDPTKRILISER